jgi:uncharacterized protein with PIN domain
MPKCPECAKHMIRTHRSHIQKIVYTDTFRCPKCGYKFGTVRPWLRIKAGYIFSRFTRCVRCGTLNVHRSQKRDRVDRPTRQFLGRIQRIVFAPLNKCEACRLQYYDWRPPYPFQPANASAAAAGESSRPPG